MSEVNWSDAIWQEINDAVVQEMHKVRVAQKVFPSSVIPGNPIMFRRQTIVNDRIAETGTAGFIEIYKEFNLLSAQVGNEENLKDCKELAIRIARQIARVEDIIIFQGAVQNVPNGVQVHNINEANQGIHGIARANHEIPVNPNNPGGLPLYGTNILTAVNQGIVRLESDGQTPDFALLLHRNIQADAVIPPSPQHSKSTSESIKEIIEGGYHGVTTLPDNTGLLVALGGDPVKIYIGSEAKVEYVRKAGPDYVFKITERIQFDVRDPEACIALNFVVPQANQQGGEQANQ